MVELTPDPDPARDRELVRTGDHDEEVCAFMTVIEKACKKYWFIGRAELIGAIERSKFRVQMNWYEHDKGD